MIENEVGIGKTVVTEEMLEAHKNFILQMYAIERMAIVGEQAIDAIADALINLVFDMESEQIEQRHVHMQYRRKQIARRNRNRR